jgi:hypothetical protein
VRNVLSSKSFVEKKGVKHTLSQLLPSASQPGASPPSGAFGIKSGLHRVLQDAGNRVIEVVLVVGSPVRRQAGKAVV